MSAYEVVPVRAFNDNYIWTVRDATHAVVVDPGDAQPVQTYLKTHGLQLAAILWLLQREFRVRLAQPRPQTAGETLTVVPDLL